MKLLWKTAGAVLLVCLLVWTAAVGYLWLNEPRMVFRSEFSRRPGRVDDPALRRLQLRTADGVRLDAVRLAHDRFDPVRYWVIYFQGNAGSLRRPRVQQQIHAFHDLGYDVLSFDYRGYGLSEGEPSENGLYEDGFAAFQYLRGQGVDSSRIILAGQSLGSAVAVEVATRVASAGVALFSPIDSVPMAASRIYPWVPARYLAVNRFDSSLKVARIRQPIVLFHSATDRLIPLAAARTLFARITAPKRMFETGGGHNNAGFADLDALRDAFHAFWPVAVPIGEGEGAAASH
jgi:fermentation-respiration switch protein FrsA (DUF1100 family)